MERKGFSNSIREIALDKEATILGEYGCKGHNTYVPWKLVGGMNKNHPTRDEVMAAALKKLYLEESFQ